MILRDYQHDLVGAIRDAFRTHRRVLAVAPTGAGTTAHSYVYALVDQDGEIFYIGKGRGKRWTMHESQVRSGKGTGNPTKDEKIASVLACLGHVPSFKIEEGLTDAEASELEIALIAAIGRSPLGPLTNITAGGDGCVNLTEEAKARMVAAQIAAFNQPSIRVARSARSKAMHADPEFKLRHRAGVAAMFADPVKRRRHALAVASSNRMPERRSETARFSKAMHADPEFKEKHRASMQAASASPEARARLRAASLARWDRVRAAGTQAAR